MLLLSNVSLKWELNGIDALTCTISNYSPDFSMLLFNRVVYIMCTKYIPEILIFSVIFQLFYLDNHSIRGLL